MFKFWERSRYVNLLGNEFSWKSVKRHRFLSWDLHTTNHTKWALFLSSKVISRNNIVLHGVKNVLGASEHTLSLKVERNMAPSSTLVVYYLTYGVHHSIETISASTNFQVDGLIQNTVSENFFLYLSSLQIKAWFEVPTNNKCSL